MLLVKQKKDIKRQKAKLDALKKEEEEERLRAKTEARERVLKEFERGQLGLGGRVATGISSTSGNKEKDEVDSLEGE